MKSKENILLSICIPTRGRIQILKNTLDSIFNSRTNTNDYEVVVYDSSDDNELEKNIGTWYKFPNLVYKKGENDGFLNLIHALEMGNGLFLKLHNDYSLFINGGLASLITEVKYNCSQKPVLFFANNSLKNKKVIVYSSFNNFLQGISFYSTWSTAFGTWKVDFDQIKSMKINPMFPHTSLLFAIAKIKNNFVVSNNILFYNQNVGKKGGYNLFKTFAVDYLEMVESCVAGNYITNKTFKQIKKDMVRNFFIYWYGETKIVKNDYTFDLSNIKNSIKVYYSSVTYYYIIAMAYSRVWVKKILSSNILKNK